jgi:uncharacterized protein (DUF1499 family)
MGLINIEYRHAPLAAHGNTLLYYGISQFSNQGNMMGLLSGKRPADLGVRNGNLKAAPSSPNAVSSQATDAHRIAPLVYQGSPQQAMKSLRTIAESTPHTRIVEAKADYLYVEYASSLLGFVDDVEFYFPPGANVIHVRSASRLGYSDLGVNRKRIEEVRARLARDSA